MEVHQNTMKKAFIIIIQIDSQKYLHIVCMYLDKIGESSQFSSLLYKFGKIPGPEQTWRKV